MDPVWRCLTTAWQAMLDEATRAYPSEACGWLLGSDGRVVATRPERNETGHAKASHYLMGPESYRDATRAARAAGLDVVGVFHSHPDHPARPSATDLAEAWPSWLYVIVPVTSGRSGEPLGWQLRDDRSGFSAVGLAIDE